MTNRDAPAQSQAWLELPDGTLHWLGRETRIGRAKDVNDLVIDERLVSSRHVNIVAAGSTYRLLDQHSTNGTYLNGMLVQKAVELKDGDEIRLAKIVLLRFRCAREMKLDDSQSAQPFAQTTAQISQVDARECWLLLADVAGYSGLIAKLGNEAALARLQAWISEMRPLIEGNGGAINSYVGDAIFAYWPCDVRSPEQVAATLRTLESFRARSPVGFRFVLHHGIALFTKSSLGEEVTGQEVNFLFRSEKIAKRLACYAMLSQAAVRSLHLEGRCDSAGTSAVEGIEGYFAFYRMPRDGATGSTPGFAKRILLVEESNVVSDGFVQLLESEGGFTVCDRAQHGASARRLHAKHHPDLVMIDLALRTGETLALIGDLLQADPQTRIMVFTALGDQGYIERALHAGALGYMLKSDPTEQVIDAIRVVSEGGMFISRQVAGAVMRQLGGHSGSTPRVGPAALSDRELDVFRLIALGQPNREIATALGISVKTVEAHRENIKVKLNLSSAAELAAAAKRWADSAADKSMQ